MQFEPSLSAEFAVRILIGFGVGAIIGVERQKAAREQGDFRILGIRSFGLLSLLGTFTSVVAYLIPDIALVVMIVGSIFAITLIGGHTWYKISQTNDPGVTTSISFGLSFLLGILVGYGYILLPVSVALFVTLILSVKEELRHLIKELSYEELIAALELGVLFLLLFPLIPDITEPFFNTINLRLLYYLLILLLSLRFLNYIALNKFGTRGLFIFAGFGGVANSEATVSSITNIARKSGEKKEEGKLFSKAIVITNATMILRNLLIAAILAPILLAYTAVPLALAFLVGIVRGYPRKEMNLIPPKVKSPFSFKSALQFTALFVGITFLTLILQRTFGETGLVIGGIIGGFAGSGAVIFSVSVLFAQDKISDYIAVITILAAVVSAVMNKLVYVKLGGGGRNLLKCVIIDTILLASIVLIFLVFISFFRF
ncbi:MAG: MgtC/SapB family protein [Promethearchaeota archaeon]